MCVQDSVAYILEKYVETLEEHRKKVKSVGSRRSFTWEVRKTSR